MIVLVRMKLLGTWRTRVPYDGLNTLNYTMTSRDFLPLCTMVHISVEAIDVRITITILSPWNQRVLIVTHQIGK